MASSNTTLHPEDRATLQAWVRENSRAGAAPSVIDATLRHTYGVSLGDVMAVTPRDLARSFAQGASLEHLDELQGTSGARDTLRADDATFAAAHPFANAGARAAGGMLPAALLQLVPELRPVAGAVGANTARGAVAGTILGAGAGAGASTSTRPADVGLDALLSATVGAGTGGIASHIASRFGGAGAERTAIQAGSRTLPLVPEEVPQSNALTIHRQHILAPNTGAVADLNDATRDFATSLVVADPKTADAAKLVTARRVQGLVNAKRQVGAFYATLQGRLAPTDPNLRAALVNAQRVVRGESQLPELDIKAAMKAGTVDLGKLHDIRSIIDTYQRRASSPSVAHKLGEISDQLTSWMELNGAPDIRAVDSDYRFLTDAHEAATKTFEALKTAMTPAIKREAAPGLTAQVPIPSRGGMGLTVLRTVNRLLGDDPKGRARAIFQYFLSPMDAQEAAARMEAFDAASGFRQPVRGTVSGTLAAGAGALVAPPSTSTR